jgi:hypothetical protein
MMSSTAYDSEIFRLVVAAAFYHPRKKTRALLRTLLERWLEELSPCHSAESVREAISSQKGTFLEPFSLSEEDLECAVFLTRAAFSKNSQQQRIRIVSRDTIGVTGGLVLTRGLKSYFIERFPGGQAKGQPKECWIFVPARVPPQGKSGAVPTVAQLVSEDSGFRIRVRMPEHSKDPASLGRGFQNNSKIEGVSEDFNRLGLRVEIKRDEVHVLTGSPESMIRMMAHMAAETTLVLQTGNTKDYCALVCMAPPEDEPVRLKAVIGAREGFANWMKAHPPVPLELHDGHKIAVSSWLPSPREWLDFTLKNLP